MRKHPHDSRRRGVEEWTNKNKYFRLKKMDTIHRIMVLVLQNWMEKRMIGMRQLLIELEFRVSAVLQILVQS